ncbi:PREDICTED: serine/threonine-protein kinase pakG-like isoform X2 [Amphimedon queenslandica]|uniref:Ig-like domain-containing protein n=1 Tax=Amphimedon queenslandica TaxID=400682 RepID=A0AAN0IYT7_AMPQE|nr:PREDICTED: serine/threonine-protein kinase pakG-like isoform X2 [Amphimedon queenslandica]|eukprot:XP_019849613.1 PREDICTED: serine/threonine-protein kinase pakG-like isoform X2 [Amphimedon queenslandica]
MERACVCVFLVLCLTQAVLCQEECKLNFTSQPLPELTCRPTKASTIIFLYCTVSDADATLTWFRTQHEDQAGINGTAINESNTSDPYSFQSINHYQPSLTFTINDDTLGYYWCEITDAKYSNLSLRLSTVTHVRNSSEYNSSLPNCPTRPSLVHFENRYDQCAIISTSSSSTVLSPTPSIPSLSPSPSLSLSATTSSSSLSFTPTQSLEPSPTTTGDTENNVFILYALAGVCGLLAVIALVIVIAIFVLCYLTKHQSRRRSYTPKGQAGEDSSGVGGRRNSDDEKPSSQLPQQNTNNNINSSHHPPPPSQIQQRGLSFSNPVYDIAKVQSSDDSNAFDVFPPRIVPPDQPKTNSLPKYAKPDLSKKKSHSDEEYVSPHNTLPSGSDGMYDQVAISPTGTSSTIGSRPPPPAEEPLELPPSLNLYDDPNQLSPILHSPPAAYEEPHLTSPNISSPPPLPPPPVESALYDDPHEVISPSQQRPDSYMQPLSLLDNINNGGEKESYYSIPADAMPHQYHELINMQESSQASTTTTTASTSAGNETSTAPDNSAAPQESAYDDPWGSMPTGIKRGSSRSSKSHGGRSHSITHSVSPNLFDDPQYDTPSPHQTTPIETNNY